jgi:Pyruvate/2-oxoacid:ferredoxin oxidoreductase gamma subunit
MLRIRFHGRGGQGMKTASRNAEALQQMQAQIDRYWAEVSGKGL